MISAERYKVSPEKKEEKPRSYFAKFYKNVSLNIFEQKINPIKLLKKLLMLVGKSFNTLNSGVVLSRHKKD